MALGVAVVCTLVLLTASHCSLAWMGSMYRNRESGLRPSDFEEEPATNLRFKAGMPVPRTGMWYQQRRSAIDLLEDEPTEPVTDCRGAACRDDGGCCEGMVCKLPQPDNKKSKPRFKTLFSGLRISAPLGTCVPNPNEGTNCKDDASCGQGLECGQTMGSRGFKTCQPRNRDVNKKQYGDECRFSMECDQVRGLCCQVYRRHRQSPRQVCMYYESSHQCLGFRKDYLPEVGGLPNKNRWWQY